MCLFIRIRYYVELTHPVILLHRTFELNTPSYNSPKLQIVIPALSIKIVAWIRDNTNSIVEPLIYCKRIPGISERFSHAFRNTVY